MLLHVFVPQVSVAARMWGRALVLVLMTTALAATAKAAEGDDGQDYESELKVGRSINIFPRYGYLSISMKVGVSGGVAGCGRLDSGSGLRIGSTRHGRCKGLMERNCLVAFK